MSPAHDSRHGPVHSMDSRGMGHLRGCAAAPLPRVTSAGLTCGLVARAAGGGLRTSRPPFLILCTPPLSSPSGGQREKIPRQCKVRRSDGRVEVPGGVLCAGKA